MVSDMTVTGVKSRHARADDLEAPAALIAQTQKTDGDIPWAENGKTDPWDLIEAAVGLNIGGYFTQARQAFDWLARKQLKDGSWYSSYRDGLPEDRTRESHMACYLAVGVLHHYLITEERSFLGKMWPSVRLAMDFALSLQAQDGQVYWALSPEGRLDPMALLTGSSSIYMSLKCALSLAAELGQNMPGWREALTRLGRAIKHRPHLFNMAKSRYSMDWFYPILCGALTGPDAQRRIDRFWDRYMVQDHGVRCVSDQPWVTIAETSELVLALAAMGNFEQARIVFNWIKDKRFDDGSCWCGYTYPDMIIWPEDKITWTNAVFLMAADALYNLTPAGQLFSHRSWRPEGLCLLL